MKSTKRQTPNFTKGFILKPTGIVWHHSAGSYASTVSWCLNPQSKVAYHIVVDTNGDYTQLAEDHQRVWANGVSSFQGRRNCNDFLLSISVSGDTNKRLLTPQEIETVARITIQKMQIYGFTLDRCTTHRHISPGRKNDIDPRSEKSHP